MEDIKNGGASSTTYLPKQRKNVLNVSKGNYHKKSIRRRSCDLSGSPCGINLDDAWTMVKTAGLDQNTTRPIIDTLLLAEGSEEKIRLLVYNVHSAFNHSSPCYGTAYCMPHNGRISMSASDSERIINTVAYTNEFKAARTCVAMLMLHTGIKWVARSNVHCNWQCSNIWCSIISKATKPLN